MSYTAAFTKPSGGGFVAFTWAGEVPRMAWGRTERHAQRALAHILARHDRVYWFALEGVA